MKINIDKTLVRVLKDKHYYDLIDNYLFEITIDKETGFKIYTECDNFSTSLGEVVKVDDHYEINYRSKVFDLLRGYTSSDIRMNVVAKRTKDPKERLIIYLEDKKLQI